MYMESIDDYNGRRKKCVPRTRFKQIIKTNEINNHFNAHTHINTRQRLGNLKIARKFILTLKCKRFTQIKWHYELAFQPWNNELRQPNKHTNRYSIHDRIHIYIHPVCVCMIYITFRFMLHTYYHDNNNDDDDDDEVENDYDDDDDGCGGEMG